MVEKVDDGWDGEDAGARMGLKVEVEVDVEVNAWREGIGLALMSVEEEPGGNTFRWK